MAKLRSDFALEKTPPHRLGSAHGQCRGGGQSNTDGGPTEISRAGAIPWPNLAPGSPTWRHRRSQCTGPGGVHVHEPPDCTRDLRQTATPAASPTSQSFIGPSRAFHLGLIAVALEHQVGDTPDVDFPDHAPGERLCRVYPPVCGADLFSATIFGLLSGSLAVSAAQSPEVAHSASAAGVMVGGPAPV
jgi:hypothetical protein